MLRRVSIAVWWVGTLALLAWGWSLYPRIEPRMQHHIDEAILFILLVPTFPMGLLTALLITVCAATLYSATGVGIPGGPPIMALTGLIVSGAGFYQWFFLVPRLMAKGRRERDTSAEVGVNMVVPDAVVKALNEVAFVLEGDASGDPVFFRRGRIREFELHLTQTKSGSWRARLRGRHPGGPWEWVPIEGLATGAGTELELSTAQLNGSFPLLLDEHIIPYADRTAFGE
jgi:hypothetical protein